MVSQAELILRVIRHKSKPKGYHHLVPGLISFFKDSMGPFNLWFSFLAYVWGVTKAPHLASLLCVQFSARNKEDLYLIPI